MSDVANSLDETIVHSSSVRCRSLLQKGFMPARLTDYVAGNVSSLLATLNSIYSIYILFHAFEEEEGDEDRIYYKDQKSGEERGVSTVYFKYTEMTKTSTPIWTIANITFQETEHKQSKLTYDYLHGKAKTYFGTLLINPYTPRNKKLRETENIIKQLRSQMVWGIEADKSVITGQYKVDGGWQWFIASEYFKTYVSQIEELFYAKKVTDLSGNVCRLYSENETSQMVADINAREKADAKRKMVAYLNSNEEMSREQLDKLTEQALAATELAQENVYTYAGRTEFVKPKKKSAKPIDVNVTCKKQQGKAKEYWRVTIWIMVGSKEMAKVPSNVMCWSLPEHPTIPLAQFGNGGKSKGSSKTFAESQKAAWSAYGSATKRKYGNNSNNNSSKQDFGGAAGTGSSSAASSPSSGSPTKKSKTRKHKNPLSHLAESSLSASKETSSLMMRMLTLEEQVVGAATKKDLANTELGFAKVASREVTKRFKAFAEIMQQFAMEMAAIKEQLTETVEEAAALMVELNTGISAEERKSIEDGYADCGLTSDQLEKIISKQIERDAFKNMATAKAVKKLSKKVSKSSKDLSQVKNQVEKTITRIAAEAGVEFNSPKVLKNKKKSKFVSPSPVASKRKNSAKKVQVQFEQISDLESISGDDSSDSSDSSDSKATKHLFHGPKKAGPKQKKQLNKKPTGKK